MDADASAPSLTHSAGLKVASRPGAGFLGLGLFRSQRRRVLGGVAGGLAERLGIDPVLVRIGFALLTLSGAAGIFVYLIMWAVVPDDTGEAEVRAPSLRRAAGIGSMLFGVMILLREAGLWLGDTVALSVGLLAAAAAIVWVRSDADERERLRGLAGRLPADARGGFTAGRASKFRIAIGATIAVGAVALFVLRSDALRSAPTIVFAVLVSMLGVALVMGPWAWRLAHQLTDERRERIRQEERAEMAAHLHDSVLQTLALIQRTDQPKEMVTLARSQERELRAWLNGTSVKSGDTIAGALEQMAAAVELQFKMPVDVVTVGDAPLDDRLRAVIEACREATINAAKHSGAGLVSIYLEVEAAEINAFIRDEGQGFALDDVASDRRGIAESIRGRMERSGGGATITAEPGDGTEVHLRMPRLRS